MNKGLSALMTGIALVAANAYAGPDNEQLEVRGEKVLTVVHPAAGTISRSIIDASRKPNHIETLSCKYGYVAIGNAEKPNIIDLTADTSKRAAAARKDCMDHDLTPNF